MKKITGLYFLFVGIIISVCSCKKDSFIAGQDAFIFTSDDTMHLGAIFTGNASTTQAFKIFNPNDQKLRISSINLAGGVNSSFKINVNGIPGFSFADIDIAANDSIYVFVLANIQQSNTSLPFLVQDSISITWNSNTAYIQLDAYGQNANYLRHATVTKDTTWNNDLPIVILEPLTVNKNATLNISKGAKIYCHANAQFAVNGTIKAIGDKEAENRIVFTGDRLDDPYSTYPDSWQGIIFTETSKDNILNFVTIKNADKAITVLHPAANSNPKLTITHSIIDNNSSYGIKAINSSIIAVNCLISNCDSNIALIAGGDYQFTHCTAASYSNLYLYHTSPVLTVSNTDENNQSYPLSASFINTIFWGEGGLIDDEINILQQGNTAFNLSFQNVLYKGSPASNFTNSIQNSDPQFLTIDIEKNIFDFHVQSTSPCIGAGINANVADDLDGNPRSNVPDIGCYQQQ
ncbi:MAG TPA: hypothetical protein PL045_00495 [Chitinophagaceae bacterium]|nr:hypothetical protein [Chitinophagaceae bacterium]